MRPPDLGAPITEPNQVLGSDRRSSDGYAQTIRPAEGVGPRSKPTAPTPKPILDAEQSAKLRNMLIVETESIDSADDAAVWAHRILTAKNTLTATDANAVESAFQARLAAFDQGRPDSGAGTRDESRYALAGGPETPDPPDISPTIEKHASRPLLQKSIWFRDKEHRKFVARQPCVVCGRAPCDPHHLRFAQPRALGRKVSDEFTVPLCRVHHRELHRHRDEAAWWHANKIDPMPFALKLWRQTRLDRTGLSVSNTEPSRTTLSS